jgi:hypothetical protein
MGNYRTTDLLASESIATAATKTIDVDINDVISSIMIRVKGTNNNSTPTGHPSKILTKIELVDGSDVLYSLSGVEAQALNFYETGRLPFNICEYENNIQCCATAHINFGRYLWDPQLGLNPNRFNNLQLKITHNKALGGSTPDAGTLYVAANIFDKKPVSPIGFLMSKEQKTYTLTASAHEYTDLNTDFPYRKLLLNSLSTSLTPSTNMSKVKLSEDGDKSLVWNDQSVSEWIKIMPQQNYVEEMFAGLEDNAANTYHLASTYENYVVGTGRSANNSVLYANQPSGSAVIVIGDASESSSFFAKGYCPHGAVEFPFGDQMNINDWYNVSGLRNLKLDITAGSSASGTVQIVSQQFRRY